MVTEVSKTTACHLKLLFILFCWIHFIWFRELTNKTICSGDMQLSLFFYFLLVKEKRNSDLLAEQNSNCSVIKSDAAFVSFNDHKSNKRLSKWGFQLCANGFYRAKQIFGLQKVSHSYWSKDHWSIAGSDLLLILWPIAEGCFLRKWIIPFWFTAVWATLYFACEKSAGVNKSHAVISDKTLDVLP